MRTQSKAMQSRVDFRLPATVKERFQEAAAYENGGDLTAFLVAAANERANRVLAQRERLQIDSDTRERFYDAMRDCAHPSEALRRLMKEDLPGFRLV